jgi:hypothetical protein
MPTAGKRLWKRSTPLPVKSPASSACSKYRVSLKAAIDDGRSTPERAATGKPDRELAAQIVRLAVEGYRRERVSRGLLRDLSDRLGMPADELVELAEAAAEN